MYCHTLFLGAEGLGEVCMKITLIISCLERLTCLLLFIMVGFEKLRPDLKMVLIFKAGTKVGPDQLGPPVRGRINPDRLGPTRIE